MAKQASVRKENLKTVDPTTVYNKDPNLKYHWVDKDDPMELNLFASLGYSPARGKEKIAVVPYGDEETNKDGNIKKRGNRILMCCDRKKAMARKQARLERNNRKPSDAAQDDANRIMKTIGRNAGIRIEATGETEVR